MENVYIYKYCHTHIIMEEIEEKKENIISFRLNNADYLKLEQVSTEQNKKKSDIVRKALDFYLGFHLSPIPMILWGRNEFGFAFESVDQEKLQEMALLSYKNGIQSLESMLESYSIQKDSRSKMGITLFLTYFINYGVSSESLNWFESIEWSWVNHSRKTLRIIGNHDLNTSFSIFFKFLFSIYLNDFDYQLTREVLLSDMLILEFSRNEKKKKEKK